MNCGILFAYEVCMKNTSKNKNENNRGAALMIALLAALIVMMAATLLISLTRRMVDSHINRMNNAQITLSEASAADGLAFLISQRGPGIAGEPLHFDLAGVSTEFTHLSTGTAGIRTGFYPVDNVERALFVTAGDRLISATRIDESSVLITFFSGDTFQSTAEFVIETDLLPAAGTPFTFHGEDGAVIVFEGSGKSLICVVTSSGVQIQTLISSSVLSSRSMLAAGEASDGTPLLIITGGSNHGILYNCQSGEPQHITSPTGTCPVFLADGSIFGSTSHSSSSSSSSFGVMQVVDVFDGDFNNDGMPDMAFTTRFSLSVFSGATGDIYRASPGGSLTSWGTVGGRIGLCGEWNTPFGGSKWLRLGYDGFTEFTPEMVYELGWQGRFQGVGNTLTGIIDGTAVVASSSGYILELLSGSIFSGDADGGETDFFSVTENGVDACFNPVNGDGVQLSFSAVNQFLGNRTVGETHVFSVYESDGRMRVFHTIEGLDQ